ncbi:MAG: HAD-IA family hydrolase [Candidatus Niyogibacteria bacterium]|nr:MAG: HAD-IA family hydrolase [Candidatus Niyogibacteria bacterium]
MKKSWIFFDLDGVLVDSVPLLKRTFFDFGRKFSVKLSPADFDKCNGLNVKEIAAYLKRKGGLSYSVKDLKKKYEEVLKKVRSGIRVKKEVLDALKKLKKRGWNLALVTSAPSGYLRAIIKKGGAEKLFDFTVSGEDFKKAKPHPEIYLKAVKKAGRGFYVAVEDSENGLAAARKAGCFALKYDRNLKKDSFFSFRNFNDLRKKLIIAGENSFLAAKITAKNKISFREDKKIHLNFFSRAEINDFWRKSRKKNSRLFDGKIFALGYEAAPFDFHGKFTDYAGAFYSAEKGRPAGPIYCGVTGIARFNGGYLLARRSNDTTRGGLYEFAPAGAIDASAQRGGRAQPLVQLKKELKEEMGFDSRCISSITPVFLALEISTGVMDVFFKIQLSGLSDVHSFFNASSEHEDFKFFSRRGLKKALRQKPEMFLENVGLVQQLDFL